MFNTQSAEQNHSGNSVQVISYFTSFLLWNNLGLHFMSWKTIHYQFSDNILIIVWCSEQFQWMMSHPQNSLLSREQIWDANQWEFNYVKKDRCSAIHQTISWQHSIKHKLNAHFYTTVTSSSASVAPFLYTCSWLNKQNIHIQWMPADTHPQLCATQRSFLPSISFLLLLHRFPFSQICFLVSFCSL